MEEETYVESLVSKMWQQRRECVPCTDYRLSQKMWKLIKFGEDIKDLANQDMLNVL